MSDIIVKFISQKISKVRWRPNFVQRSEQPNCFATGNWDDEDGKVCLWESFGAAAVDMDAGFNCVTDREPRLMCEAPHMGDVTDLEFVGPEQIITASSTGSVTLFKHNNNSQTLAVDTQWQRIHYDIDGKGSTCTCLAVYGEDMMVTGGEDGRINVLNLTHGQPLRNIDKANSCVINGIKFLKQLEVITADSIGQMRVYDLRQTSDDPVRTYSMSSEQTPLQSIARHPTQHHIIATGSYNGLLSIWDLRLGKYPVTLLESHSAAIWEVKFHPDNPVHLFTCSEDGSVMHWNSSLPGPVGTGTGAGSGGGTSFSQRLPPGGAVNQGIPSPWLNLESGRNRMEITTLLPNQCLPINSLDIEAETLVCGTDEEAVYTIDLSEIR